jgi:uncharacterized protein DUF4926
MIASGAAASAVVRYDGVKAPAVAFEQYSDVILTQDIQECDLRTDDIGTVVECHSVAGTGTGYSVEFFDMVGNTVAVWRCPTLPSGGPQWLIALPCAALVAQR